MQPLPSNASNASNSIATYLGPRGYTIHKENLDEEERKYIRTELTIRPYIPKAPVQPAAYPIYRESPLKMYVPRYFGIGAYGPPEAIKIGTGEPIDVAFQGDMRDYQKDIVRKYLNHVGAGGGGLLDVDPGKGKTVMALYILAQLRRKTLVVVHKSFLMNQWIERIEQFLPGARVGRIQGQVVDIDDKDIVLGMLQSLSMKEYPADMFDSFGLTVFDEVHHMGAEVFCQCMMKVTTMYTLGLSGTMQRKDGLTKVFKMFLGDVVHKEKAASEHRVVVKAINYCVDDAAFNETEYDYRGNPKFSTMISRVCDYAHRSEFILRVLQKELAENPDQQVMILGHNKSLLTYLHKAIEHRGIADGSVGYYVGGMKEADLKASESRTVIIATYAMASEGLDIKTLTTLIMASPKTDVCQSVGRILRVKHGRPLVIDIVDQQDIFRNQWQKRRAYYVKQNYDILMTDSPTYDAHDAHHPVQWTPDHVAKNMDAKAKILEAKGAKANALESNANGSESKETKETKGAKGAKGWVGLPIMF
jgi:superfamily II DNA or RNA helicase